TYRQLDDWARRGALVPAARTANGYGSRRRYTTHDLFLAALFVDLSAFGFDVAAKQRTTRMIRSLYPDLTSLPGELWLDADGFVYAVPPRCRVAVTIQPTIIRDTLNRVLVAAAA